MAPSSLSAGLYKLPLGMSICRMCAQSLARQQKRRIGTKVLAKRILAHNAWQERAQKIDNGELQNTWDMLVERGYVKDTAGRPEQISRLMKRKRIGAYVGIDPTANSLHVGHLLPLMPLFWMYLHGYTAVSLVGGATARIGDPTDRLQSREIADNKDIALNLAKIHYQLKRIWVNVDEMGRRFGYEKEWATRRSLVNNSVWWNKVPLQDVMKRLGRYIRIGPMLSRDTVKRKMTEGDGMSFAEFTYPLMQGWDFWQLYQQMGVQMQIGGSDQFGNIVTGVDTVKIVRDSETAPALKMDTDEDMDPCGFTVPLLTDSSGAKFGKSAGNAIWLDPFMTVPFDLYGYFMRRPDDDVEKLLKLLTFLPLGEIEKVMEKQREDPSKRVAQHVLALEAVSLVHGHTEARQVQKQHQMLFGGDPIGVLNITGAPDSRAGLESDYAAVEGHPTTLNNAPKIEMQLPESLIRGKSIAKILLAAGLVKSASEGNRLAIQGGAYVAAAPGRDKHGLKPGSLTWTPVINWLPEHVQHFLIEDRLIILRKGKYNIRTIEIIPDEEYAASGKTYPGQEGTGAIRRLRAALEEKAAAEGKSLTNLELKEQVKEAVLAKEEKDRIKVTNNPDIEFPTRTELYEVKMAKRAAEGKSPQKKKLNKRMLMKDAQQIVAEAMAGNGEETEAVLKIMSKGKVGHGKLAKQLDWTKDVLKGGRRTVGRRRDDMQRRVSAERARMRSEVEEEDMKASGWSASHFRR